jgi:hypothetical protein
MLLLLSLLGLVLLHEEHVDLKEAGMAFHLILGENQHTCQEVPAAPLETKAAG